MPEKILGLDIGEYSIKAVQITAGLKGYQVTGFSLIDIKEAGGSQEALKKLFENDNLKSGICITSLPAKSFSFRNIKLPFKDKKKIGQTIAFELEPLIPYPAHDVLIDYIIVDRSDQSEIFAAATVKSGVGELVKLLEEHHAEVSIIDIDAVPVASKLLTMENSSNSPLIKGEEYGLLLDIGAEDTAGILFKEGKIFQIRRYPFGGDKITGAVARALNIEFANAEKKKRKGDTAEAGEEISGVCHKFFLEVKNTLQFLKWNGYIDKEPSKIFLTGGGALYPGIREELREHFSVPVDMVDISATDNIQMEGTTRKSWNPMLMNQALALATRETKKGAGFNFRRGEFELKRKYEKFKKDFRWAAALALIVMFACGIDLYIDYHYDRLYLNKLKHEIITVFKKTCPEVTRIVDPVQQMKVKIAELRKSSTGLNGANVTTLHILKDISRLVPESTDFLITRFTFDGKSIEIKGETDNFNAVDNIKTDLGKSNYFKNVATSSASRIKKGKRVGFDLRMELSSYND
ncbi:MAG: pilus assembly protein PilM [Proteobacteria bacterium]|nr:pilus assembly protein PilM [Pseudomonadota bacterium]